MKLLHTADWHLGDSFHGYDRDSEHRHFLNWLSEVIDTEQPDALLVAGDIYDNANPSAQAEEMLFNFMASVKSRHNNLRIILTAGNHDSGRRLQAPARLLRDVGVEVIGVVPTDAEGNQLPDKMIIPVSATDDPEDRALVLAVPYLRISDYDSKSGSATEGVRQFFSMLVKRARKSYGKDIPIVIMAHLYAVGSEIAALEHSERLVVGGEDCIDITGLDNDVAYVALGHIHKPQQVGGNDRMMFYAGSPLPMSFSEKGYPRGINKITLGAGGVVVDRIDYSPLREIKSLPSSGAASLTDIMQQINALPKASREDADRWPYLEVRLKESEPSPTAPTEILSALQEKAVRLCRLVRVIPEDSTPTKQRKMKSLEQLRNISPLDIAHDAYLQATGQEMSDELAARFKQAADKAATINDENL
ncbi:MAG: exonuclease SbcCD subunit D [Bacteroidaceae bacterium]|nr:exonuclease SbcCD subunit D [Bacteroidaceae bacterium]